jgi:hypothetical protein
MFSSSRSMRETAEQRQASFSFSALIPEDVKDS